MNYSLWINGRWTEPVDGRRMAILNPATGAPIADVVDAGRADVDAAVQAARAAFYDGRWSRLTPGERSLAIWRLADLLDQQAVAVGRHTRVPGEKGTRLSATVLQPPNGVKPRQVSEC